jgi:hypothetical protein
MPSLVSEIPDYGRLKDVAALAALRERHRSLFVKAISHRAFGFRTTWTHIANIYHCCAALPLS